MDKYELDDIIFDFACEVFYQNDNWIEYGDLLQQTTAKVREVVPEITIDAVEKWIKDCIAAEYISVARLPPSIARLLGNNAEIAADDYCRGEWLGLDKDKREIEIDRNSRIEE